MVPTITPILTTETIIPASTSTSIPSITPTNTATPEPTLTETLVSPQDSTPLATSRSILRLKPAISIPEAGFSFQPLMGYVERYQAGQVTLTSEDEDIILSLIGSSTRRKQDLEYVLNRFLEVLQDTFQDFDTGTPYPYTIGGTDGLAVDVNAEYNETPVEGRIAIVVPNGEQLFYIVAISANGEEGLGWEPKGRQAFEAVVDSITFFKPKLSEQQD